MKRRENDMSVTKEQADKLKKLFSKPMKGQQFIVSSTSYEYDGREIPSDVWVEVKRGYELDILAAVYKINPDFVVEFFDGFIGKEERPAYVAVINNPVLVGETSKKAFELTQRIGAKPCKAYAFAGKFMLFWNLDKAKQAKAVRDLFMNCKTQKFPVEFRQERGQYIVELKI